MNAKSKKDKSLDELLSDDVEKNTSHVITLIAMVRKSNDKSFIEIALDDTGSWVAIPRALIASASAAGQISFSGSTFNVLELMINRPNDGGPWFDLLEFVLRRVALLVQQPSKCGCDSSDAPVGVHKRAGRQPIKTTTANCVSCWIMTMGSLPGFCYTYGHCDN